LDRAKKKGNLPFKVNAMMVKAVARWLTCLGLAGLWSAGFDPISSGVQDGGRLLTEKYCKWVEFKHQVKL
jgi:hypothetical protein